MFLPPKLERSQPKTDYMKIILAIVSFLLSTIVFGMTPGEQYCYDISKLSEPAAQKQTEYYCNVANKAAEKYANGIIQQQNDAMKQQQLLSDVDAFIAKSKKLDAEEKAL